ncbi:MAG: response regulator [Sulfitobacter sp.]
MKILAVDDDPIILELLSQFMESVGGHELTTAESGFEALALLEANTGPDFDCFLFDIQMPQMDGVELTRKVKAMKRYADSPVMMLTAMSEKRYIDSVFAAGATDYVTKPFEVSELQARLKLLETHVSKRVVNTKKIFATETLSSFASDEQINKPVQLHEPLSIYDVENVIDHVALENYVAQLSRGALFGSSVFAFSIRKIDEFHANLSPFEFKSLIADAAEIISDTLQGFQFLMAYAGNGTFLCVTDSGWQPDLDKLKDIVNLGFLRTEIYDNSGNRLRARVVVGKTVRLVWKSGNALMEALADAHTSAEQASIQAEREHGSIWLTEQRA